MNQTSSHLTIDELLAHATGAPTEISTRLHLASCDQCQTELRRWTTTASGVRLLHARTRPPVGVLDRVFERVDQAPPVPPRRTSGVRIALAAAASVALIAAGTYAVSSYARAPNTPPDGQTTNPATVAVAADFVSTDCASLQVVSGTLESVSGSTLVVHTSGDRTVGVTTSDDTTITRQAEGSLADVKVGKQVFVNGTGESGGSTISAEQVAVFEPLDDVASGFGGAPGLGRFMIERGNVAGKVTAVSDSGFTVEALGDVSVRVEVSSKTKVLAQTSVAADELKVGERTVAVGAKTADHVLAARTVSQGQILAGLRPGTPSAPNLPDLPGLDPGKMPPDLPKLNRDLFKGLGCDADAIATTAMNTTG